jgi:hypothetical protein
VRWRNRGVPVNRNVLAAVLAVALAALVIWGVYGQPVLNTDLVQALIWGRDIADGVVPEYRQASTPHPLPNLIGALLSLLGHRGAFDAAQVMALIFLAGLAVAIYQLGRRIGNFWTGLIAALLFTASLAWSLVGYFDVLGLGLLAAALSAVIDRRLLAAGALLLGAGLVRPDYWLLSGAFSLWLVITRPKRWREAAAMALAAPVIWIAGDTIVTGHPLFSLTRTQDLADALGRRQGLGEAPDAYSDALRLMMEDAVLGAGAIGLAVALKRQDRGVLPFVVVVAAGLLAWAAIGVAGLSLIARYLAPTALVLTVMAAYAATSWDGRILHRAVAAIAALLLLTAVPTEVDNARDYRRAATHRAAVIDGLRDAATRARSCPPARLPAAVILQRAVVAQTTGVNPGEVRVGPGPGALIEQSAGTAHWRVICRRG